MEVVRLHLKQTSANYRKEESIENKMTYPLPPASTIIGALHNVCGFKEYHPMDVSIQGEYHTLGKEAYTDYCFLNSTQDDRGILVKMFHEDCLSKGYQRVGYAMKSQGNSFRDGKTVMIENEELIQEYRDLLKKNEEIQKFKKTRYDHCVKLIKKRKTTLAAKKKKVDKKSEEYLLVVEREKEIKEIEKSIKEQIKKYEYENYTKPYARFRTLTTSLKYYEVLYDIELIIHIEAVKEVLDAILEHIYELKSLGRSEDFVEIVSAEKVILQEVDDECDVYISQYHSYVPAELIEAESVYLRPRGDGMVETQGTKYYINKNYKINEEGQRIFEKKKVYYTSEYCVYDDSESVYLDKSFKNEKCNKEHPLIVAFL